MAFLKGKIKYVFILTANVVCFFIIRNSFFILSQSSIDDLYTSVTRNNEKESGRSCTSMSYKTNETAKPFSSSKEESKLLLADPEYYNTVEHRGGWKSVISFLKSSKVIAVEAKEVFNETSILLVDVIERWFIWKKKGTITHPWIGICHFPLDIPEDLEKKLPDWLKLDHLRFTIEDPSFLSSLPYCVGIVVLSDDLADGRLQKIIHQKGYTNHINICSLYHPIGVEQTARLYNSSTDTEHQISSSGKIVFLGQQLRRLSTSHRLKTTREKIWLPGTQSEGNLKRLNSVLEIELTLGPWAHDESVKVAYTNSFEEYDSLVKTNIVVIDLWAATANNAVLEAIALNAPFFVRKLPSTIQYIGENYPLLFSSFEELQQMIKNEHQLKSLLLSGHIYLKHMDKSKLSLEYFGSTLKQCAANGINERQVKLHH